MRHYYVTVRQRQLEVAASRFLKKRGYRGDGLPKGSVDHNQRNFEKSSLVKIPMGGQQGFRRC